MTGAFLARRRFEIGDVGVERFQEGFPEVTSAACSSVFNEVDSTIPQFGDEFAAGSNCRFDDGFRRQFIPHPGGF